MAHHLRAMQQRLSRQRAAQLLPLARQAERQAAVGGPVLPMDVATAMAVKLLPQEFDAAYIPRRDAFRSFRAGKGTLERWRDLVDLVNLGEALAGLRIASDHIATFTAAQQALFDVNERHRRTFSWTLRPAEILALDLAVQVFRAQLLHCSRGELKQANDFVHARAQAALHGQVAPGTLICAPAQPNATKATA